MVKSLSLNIWYIASVQLGIKDGFMVFANYYFLFSLGYKKYDSFFYFIFLLYTGALTRLIQVEWICICFETLTFARKKCSFLFPLCEKIHIKLQHYV